MTSVWLAVLAMASLTTPCPVNETSGTATFELTRTYDGVYRTCRVIRTEGMPKRGSPEMQCQGIFWQFARQGIMIGRTDRAGPIVERLTRCYSIAID